MIRLCKWLNGGGRRTLYRSLLRLPQKARHSRCGFLGVVPSVTGGRKQQAVHAPVEETGFKLSPQAPTEAVPPAARPVSPRVVEAEVVHEVARQESASRVVSTSPGEANVTATVVDVTITGTSLPVDQADFTMPELSTEDHTSKKPQLTTDEYIQALAIMIKSPDDRIGTLGALGATGLGAVAGWGAVATLGATTITGAVTAPVLGLWLWEAGSERLQRPQQLSRLLSPW